MMKAGAFGLAARPIADPRGEFQDNLGGLDQLRDSAVQYSEICGSGAKEVTSVFVRCAAARLAEFQIHPH